jgi:hypothetical protein
MYEGDYEDYFGEAYAHVYGTNLTTDSGPLPFEESLISALRAYVVFYNFGDFMFWDGTTTYETGFDDIKYSLSGPSHFGEFDGSGCRNNATWGTYDNGTVYYDSVRHCPTSLVDDGYLADGPVTFLDEWGINQYLFLYQQRYCYLKDDEVTYNCKNATGNWDCKDSMFMGEGDCVHSNEVTIGGSEEAHMFIDVNYDVYIKTNQTGEYWCQDYFHCINVENGYYYFDYDATITN